MQFIRNDVRRVVYPNGEFTDDPIGAVDITAEVVELDLHGKLRDLLAATREQLEDRRARRAELAAEIGAIDAELSAARSDRELAVLRRQRRTLVAAQQVERDTAEALRACRMLARLLLGALDDTEPDVDGA